MAHVIEIRNREIVATDAPDELNLPTGTRIDRDDGFYVSFGMDIEGPYSRDEAYARIAKLKKATRMDLEEEDRRKQTP